MKKQTNHHFSIQIKCPESPLEYVTALDKSEIGNKQEAIDNMKDKAKKLKKLIFWNKSCKVTVIDELTGKKYEVMD